MDQNPPMIKIDRQDLELLPHGRFEGQVVVVESEEAVQAACDYLSSCPAIGFDTETRPSFTAGATNRVALLQLSSPERCYLFRLCCMKMDKPLVKLLESEKVVKVGADIRNDLRAMQHLRHFRPRGFVDLQGIIRNHGIDELSLRKMAAAVLGIRISKAQRLSNWEAAHLTEAQCSYAATDAWVSLEIYRKLHENTDTKG